MKSAQRSRSILFITVVSRRIFKVLPLASMQSQARVRAYARASSTTYSKRHFLVNALNKALDSKLIVLTIRLSYTIYAYLRPLGVAVRNQLNADVFSVFQIDLRVEVFRDESLTVRAQGLVE